MKKSEIFWLAGIVLVSGTLGVFSLTRGHVWWDDFAGYLLQARSILSWQMDQFIIHNRFTIENSSYPPGPIAYPWGFPLLLVPVVGIFGLHPLALKLVEVFFFCCFVVGTFFLGRSRLGTRGALLVCAFLGFAPAMLSANDLILSDLPFLAVSTISLVLIEQLSPQASRSGRMAAGLLVGFAIFWAYFLRTNGVLLFAPLLVHLFFLAGTARDRIRLAISPVIVFTLLVLVQAWVFPGGQTSYFSHFSMFGIARLFDNVIYYLWLPSWVFDQIPGGGGFYVLFVFFAFAGLLASPKRYAALIAYSSLTMLLFIVWPERQGLRFIYPILPVFFVAAADGMDWIGKKLTPSRQRWGNRFVVGFWFLLAAAALFISAVSAYQVMGNNREINGPFDIYSYEMYEFVRDNTPVDSIMIFVRPRALRLFTDRDAFMTENCVDLSKGDYLILHLKMEDNGQIAPDRADSCGQSIQLEEVFRNRRFVVLKIRS